MAYYRTNTAEKNHTKASTFNASVSGNTISIPSRVGISTIKGCAIVSCHIVFDSEKTLVQTFPGASLSGNTIQISGGGPSTIKSVDGTFLVWGDK